MPENSIERISKTTPDLVRDQVERLKQLFPECVTEGSVDFDRLRATLGDLDALAGEEAYTFTWAGRQEAFRAMQAASHASLAPAPEESVNWDETRHLFIEGENLEVLKLLYKSYFGRVKMIYIDPPYNTGNDFIYQDDYSQPRRAYLEKTGQMDAEGNLLRTNTEASGRFHSDWLSMMYPRLFLARQLLREDGVIFVSIDDNEAHNLRLLMNEIFGEENFLITFIWHRRQMPDSRNIDRASTDHEYVLCYHRPGAVLAGKDIDLSKYQNPDNDPRGPWFSADLTGLANKERRPNLHYDIVDPDTGNVYPPSPTRGWSVSKETLNELIEEGRILWPSKPTGRPRRKKFLSEINDRKTSFSSMLDVGFTAEGTRTIQDLFGEKIIQFPKPVSLIRTLVEQGASDGGIVLDFFAGSCATAQAVLETNREDGENLHFIMVQIAEPVDNSEFSTISDIGKERIRRVIAQMSDVGRTDSPPHNQQIELPLDGEEHADQDLGFKVFKLAPSTFRQWEPPEGADAEALEQQLSYFDRGLEEGADPRHVIYEVILKEGYSLNSSIEPLELESNRVYRVTDVEVPGTSKVPGTLEPAHFYICLDDAIQQSTVDALTLDKETVFICLDTALDDSQKVNLSLQCLLKVI